MIYSFSLTAFLWNKETQNILECCFVAVRYTPKKISIFWQFFYLFTDLRKSVIILRKTEGNLTFDGCFCLCCCKMFLRRIGSIIFPSFFRHGLFHVNNNPVYQKLAKTRQPNIFSKKLSPASEKKFSNNRNFNRIH